MSDKLLIRCPMCNRENYALNVATGVCSWCSYSLHTNDFEVTRPEYIETITLTNEEYEAFEKMINAPMSDKQRGGLKRLKEAAKKFDDEVSEGD